LDESHVTKFLIGLRSCARGER